MNRKNLILFPENDLVENSLKCAAMEMLLVETNFWPIKPSYNNKIIKEKQKK